MIITDDLEMGGISTNLPAPQGAQEALAAGADLLLICNNWQAAWDTARLLAAGCVPGPPGPGGRSPPQFPPGGPVSPGIGVKGGAGIFRPAALNPTGASCES